MQLSQKSVRARGQGHGMESVEVGGLYMLRRRFWSGPQCAGLRGQVERCGGRKGWPTTRAEAPRRAQGAGADLGRQGVVGEGRGRIRRSQVRT